MSFHNHLFIINELSGTQQNKKEILNHIQSHFPDANVIVIKQKSDFPFAIEESKKEQYQYIIINGGDGTINSFLPVIIEQNKVLGIIPSGSGNGLARTLKIPLHPIKAIENILKKNKIYSIDVGKILIHSQNILQEKYFACAVGMGIDAYIAHRFEQQKTRGLYGYILASIKEWKNYQPIKAKIETNQQTIPVDSYLILSIMNIPQYGNDFYLAPTAQCNDGQLNLVLLPKVSVFSYPCILWNILRKKTHHSLKILESNKIDIYLHQRQFKIHIDGEPLDFSDVSKISIQIIPHSLKVI
ncbi:MAG: diacylglycerol kinase family lipid kinase [Bacteroidia bacterium]